MTNNSSTSVLVRLVFRGEIVSGHRPEDAKRKLGAALGIAPDQVDEIFSGRRVILKNSLPAEEASRYLAKLERIGIVARAEAQPEDPRDTSPTQAAAAVSDSPASTETTAGLRLVADAPRGDASASIEEVACPKCGTRQPKRTLCLNCSTDMPRYAAAQKALQQEQRVAQLASLKGSSKPAVPSGEAGQDDYAIEGAGLFGLNLTGRIGRIAYLTGSAVIGAIGLVGAVASIKTGFWLALIPLVLAMAYLSLRLSVLRCHDIGWSGWWALVLLVPYAGSLFSLILLIVPGVRGSNDFGRASRPPGVPAVAASVAVLALAGVWGFNQAAKVMATLAQYNMSGAHARTTIEDYDPRTNTVVMYSLSTCGYCVAKRRELDDLGIRYTELFLDGEGHVQEQLASRLEQAGMPRQAYGTPIIEVNGVILPNNPPIDEIVQLLRPSKG